MPRIIVKCRYYQSEKTRKSIGGLLQYIATREGVAKLSDGQSNKPATEKQKANLAGLGLRKIGSTSELKCTADMNAS